MKNKTVSKAVIPAAGFGTRMFDKSVPKEMLTVGRKPMVRHAVDEVLASGISEIIIVIRKGKEIIKDYFLNPDIRGREFPELDRLDFVYQERPLGLGDALRCAQPLVGEEPFVMVIPDQLLFSDIPATGQLVEKFRSSSADVMCSLVKIPQKEKHLFPGSRGLATETEGDVCRVRGFMDDEPQLLLDGDYVVRGLGRTVYPASVFEFLSEDYINPASGEVDLYRTFLAIVDKLDIQAVTLQGRACDFGTWEGYLHFTKSWREMER